ncbi:MAG TPA: hypothetical protein VF166_00025 [Gemmatimonadaceae bacterium]
MDAAVASHLSAWETFYLITGPSAAVLIGLQFVVIALLPDTGRGGNASAVSVSAFGTPTILHFCTVFLLAGILVAPWSSSTGPAIAIGVAGAIGVVYMVLAMTRSRRQSSYTPVLEDWIWYSIVPLVAYIALIVAAFVMPGDAEATLFIVGAVVLLLLFLGIRNAWDTVVYLAVEQGERRAGTGDGETDAAPTSAERSG